MESALEEIEFLALSENRVRVLDLLAEGPRTRSTLADATGASQATLGRILGDFEERSWIAKDGSEYRTTATGRLVARGFTDLLEILGTERDLREVVDYLPTDAMDFDLRRLSEATITVPTETRPNAPLQRLVDLEREAGTVRAFSHAFDERTLSLARERTAQEALTFEGVFSRRAIDALAGDRTLRERLASLLEAERASVRVCETDVPVAGTIADDVVHLLIRDGSGVLRASIDTDDPVVHEWAETTFANYWESGRALGRTDLYE